MKTLAAKLRDLISDSTTIEELSVATLNNGVQLKFSLLSSLINGKSTNPARTKIISLAKALETPVRYLADDCAQTPLDAVLQDAKYLSSEDKDKLITALSGG